MLPVLPNTANQQAIFSQKRLIPLKISGKIRKVEHSLAGKMIIHTCLRRTCKVVATWLLRMET